jgi:hypothetical protein
MKYSDEYYVCSRNLSLKFNEKNENTAYFKMWNKYDIHDILEIENDIAIQGEICGPGINKNPMKLSELDLYIFNIYDIKNGKYKNYKDFIIFCNAYGLKTVPIINECFLFNHNVESLLALAKGKYEGTDSYREGIVIRPLVNCYSEVLSGRLSIKIINNDYLLSE